MEGKDSFIGRLLGNAEKFNAEQVAQTVQLLIEHGIRWHASDIHIEPHDNYVLVRYRVEGELKGAHKITRKALEALTQKVKELSHLDQANSHTPQQGSFTITTDSHPYIIKVSVMPVYGGEKTVLHITPKIREPYKLETLGFWGESLQILQNALARSHGLLVVSAPRHHGRPTTQASMLAALNNPSSNIVTIEESVEFRIPHASQTAINPRVHLTMLSGLQAALHQDPNVIMVGNLPDRPVAELAIQTAMSGHLVVAGLHSDSAASSLMHLRAMNVAPYLLASTIKVAVGQRLARQLCEHCRERYELTAEQEELLVDIFGIKTAGAFRKISSMEQEAISLGIGQDVRPSSTQTKITHLWRPHREGCDECSHTGYKGRVALVEVLPVDEKIQHLLLSPDTTTASLYRAAVKEGFTPLAHDGLVKALRGIVTIKDVLRVVDRSLR